MSEPVEMEPEIPVEQMGPPSTILPQTLLKMRKIIDSLSYDDSIKIFIYAQDGIPNSTVAIKKLGLTQKRYYTRLRQLLEAGVLEKREGSYQYTFLGTILYQMVKSFKTIIEQKDRLELANKLRKTETLSLEEKKNLMRLITPTEIGGISSLADLISQVRVIDDYEELVKNLVDAIDQADDSIYLVSRYNDIRVIEAITRALNRNVKIRALSEKNGIINRINMLKTLISPRILEFILEAAKEFSDRIRKTNISYSFVVLDEKLVGIEVPHPTRDSFYLGFFFQNANICKRLIITFNEMWEKATKISLL